MKRGTPDHPKVFDLMERLGCDRATAIGHLELLWHFTAKYAPQGDIGRYSDARIEAGIDWGGRGKPKGKLIRALVEARWIDWDAKYRLKIHDWNDHADDATRKRLQRSGLCFVNDEPELTGHKSDTDRILSASQSDNGGLPEPIQIQALPEPEPKPIQISDESSASRKSGASAPDCSSSPSSDLIEKLRLEIRSIRGEDPKPWVLTKAVDMAGGHIEAVVSHLRNVPPWHRPGGRGAVRTWKWFFSTIERCIETWENLNGLENPHNALPSVDLDAMTAAFDTNSPIEQTIPTWEERIIATGDARFTSVPKLRSNEEQTDRLRRLQHKYRESPSITYALEMIDRNGFHAKAPNEREELLQQLEAGTHPALRESAA